MKIFQLHPRVVCSCWSPYLTVMSVTAALVHHSPSYSYTSSVVKTPGIQQVPTSPGLHSPLHHGSVTFQLFSGNYRREGSPVARVPDAGTSLLRQVLRGRPKYSIYILFFYYDFKVRNVVLPLLLIKMQSDLVD